MRDLDTLVTHTVTAHTRCLDLGLTINLRSTPPTNIDINVRQLRYRYRNTGHCFYQGQRKQY
ncbi:hypothetical protein PDRPxv_9 [Mycobacterium phage PDRPxv]|uniref:Uncharacterized protein n=1 Tax=Mycobacterium phage PDRPxv TaxID=1640883 RepID=A0A161BY11_9CAUD|nr:hypothetical protein PDRPxv_9 [Mycobacterium phage PDRPxv]